jgi:putative flippase GtrA
MRVHQVPVGASRQSGTRRSWRQGGRPLSRQVVVFTTVGVLSTLAYLALFVLLRAGLGPFAANAIALGLTAIANTAANRRFTFGVTAREGRFRHQLQGLLVFAVALAITTGSLAVLHAVTAAPSRAVEAATLLVANLAATALRFVLLRQWVFRGTSPAEAMG